MPANILKLGDSEHRHNVSRKHVKTSNNSIGLGITYTRLFGSRNARMSGRSRSDVLP